MEYLNLEEIKPGDTLVLKTRSGSTYTFLADTAIQLLAEGTAVSGLFATRESDHQLGGRPQAICQDPAVLDLSFTKKNTDGVLRTGERVVVRWDSSHPSEKDWEWNAGPRFDEFFTSPIVDIQLTPAE